MSNKTIAMILILILMLLAILYISDIQSYQKTSEQVEIRKVESAENVGKIRYSAENTAKVEESEIIDKGLKDNTGLEDKKCDSNEISCTQIVNKEVNINQETKEDDVSKKDEEKKYIVCIDPGHQSKGNYNKEPIGPGSSILKAKVSSGTRGVATKVPEYKLNLEVSLLLKEKLENQGYTVVMTREINDVDISNKERAEMANNAKANVFLRIHADGSSSSKTHGLHILCPAKNNQYTKDIYEKSNKLAKIMIEELVASTEAKSKGIAYRKDISGFNWSKVPVVLIEMGFMTNPQEDKKLATKEYQDKIGNGILNGLNEYFKETQNKNN